MVDWGSFWELHRCLEVEGEGGWIRRKRKGGFDEGRDRRSGIEESGEHERESVLWRQPFLLVVKVSKVAEVIA